MNYATHLFLICTCVFFGTANASEDKARAAIKQLAPEAQIDSLKDVGGLYEVTLGAQVVYVTPDGKHLINGTVLEVATRKNLTELAQAQIKRVELAKFPSEKRIQFLAKDEKEKITVFTAIDCGYCRKMHEHVSEFNRNGISVEYLMLPRAGLESLAAQQAQWVWCAADQQQALTLAKAGKDIEQKTCNNPIPESIALAQKLGINVTPTVIASNGQVIGGYLTLDGLQEKLAAIKTAP